MKPIILFATNLIQSFALYCGKIHLNSNTISLMTPRSLIALVAGGEVIDDCLIHPFFAADRTVSEAQQEGKNIEYEQNSETRYGTKVRGGFKRGIGNIEVYSSHPLSYLTHSPHLPPRNADNGLISYSMTGGFSLPPAPPLL